MSRHSVDIFFESYKDDIKDMVYDYSLYVLQMLNLEFDAHVTIYDDADDDYSFGYIIKASPNSFDVYIAKWLSKEEILETIGHELYHIKDDMSLTYNLRDLEAETKGKEFAKRYMEITYE